MKYFSKIVCIFCLMTTVIYPGCSKKELPLFKDSKAVIPIDKEVERSDCDTLVFTCIDYRFAFANQEFLNEKLGLNGNYDHISVPGSILNLVNPATQDIVFSKVTGFINFHLIKRVVIIGHRDCGGYGGSSAFGSKVAELVYLSTDLKKARQILIEKYPTLEVDLYLETLTREGVHFDKVK
ncbi:MAG: hypothetical protein FJ264_10590 [Planctomycetes bacterium]|nr:hypothetical protein [Planctomycetota bacterium]